jgi:hypothetical protein
MYWSYWPAPAGYGKSADQPGMLVSNRDGMVRIAFHTDHDQVLVGCLPERGDVARYKAAPLQALRAALAPDPALSALVQTDPCEAVRGFIPQRYFLRRGLGPGWALLGDAGVHKEFVTGDGMTEALLQARSLAAALGAGTAELERWAVQRDLAALPMYYFGKLQGAAGAPPKLDSIVLAHVAKDAELRERIVQTLTHELSPFEAVPTGRVLGWILQQLLLGRFGVLREMLERGRRMRDYQRALSERTAHLVSLSARGQAVPLLSSAPHANAVRAAKFAK